MRANGIDDAPSLFSDEKFHQALERKRLAIRNEVESIEPDQLLNTSDDDLESYYEDKYQIEPITLNEEAIYVDQSEVEIDVSSDPSRDIRRRSEPFFRKGTANKFIVPFSGDASLFDYRPSTSTLASICASVSGNELIYSYETTSHDAKGIRTRFDRDLVNTRQHVEWINADVSSYNASVRANAQSAIHRRKQKILANRGLVSELGFPMRRRADTPRTYSTPEVRRKPEIRRPVASSAPFRPDPALDLKEYDHILSVINNMVRVMERSPTAFAGMKEEDLRHLVLVLLNGHSEGQATGETFNYEGKTDILIRSEDRNIFVAECKFWHGAKAFSETIDQILGYSAWRDTKIAIPPGA